MSRYDEDLYDNPFFVALEKEHKTLFDEATANRWIICIPRFSSISTVALVKKDFEDHILISDSENEAIYKTFSKHDVTVHQGLIVLGSGFEEQKQVEILFEETFYNSKDESYRVLCVEAFFNRKTEGVERNPGPPRYQFTKCPEMDIFTRVIKYPVNFHTEDVKTDMESDCAISKPPATYNDCLRILWAHTGSGKTKDILDKTLHNFCSTYQRSEGDSLSSLVDLVSTHVTKAMQIVLKDQTIRLTVKENDTYMANLKIAVEMYMMNATHEHLFSTITACVKSADAVINKVTRNLVDIRLHHLGVRKEFEENLPAAKKEIAKLNQYSTPLCRLFCLKRVVTAVTKPVSRSGETEGLMMTTDDFLPLLIYLIIKSQIPNWMANLMYMKSFQQARVMEHDEFSFYLSTTEAALDYISGGNVKIDNSQSSLQKPAKPVGNTDTPGLKRQGSGGGSSTKDKFFQYVQFGDETAVCMMLKKPVANNSDVLPQLCHPLCTCDRCTEILARNKRDSGAISILARDDMGRTALHIAAFYGQARLIDILVKNGALADATDYLGCTPLHRACQKGYQNIILLLVHFGSDISSVDNEGNTPLHLCAKNGHEDCVKAILFLDILKNRLNVNAKNDIGDTPLHLAAKWGYEGIVKFLLDTEADPRIRNRKGQTPLSFAQNLAIKRELQVAFNDPPPVVYNYPKTFIQSHAHINPTLPPTPVVNPTPPSTLPGVAAADLHEKAPIVDQKPRKLELPLIDNTSSQMMSPKTPVFASLDVEDNKQKEKLFKAIKNKDIELVKFYLGWTESPEFDDEYSPNSPTAGGATLCHPLCQCSKCKPLQKNISGSSLHVNCQNKKGYSPTHVSVLENNMEALNLFLKKGAKVNIKTRNNITPLHLACHCSNMQMVEALVKCGAMVNTTDEHGEIPLHLACSRANHQIALFLIQHSSSVNLGNVNGNTALHHAAIHNSIKTVKVLLDNGAEPDMPNKHNATPASMTENPVIHKLLQEARERAKPLPSAKTGSPEMTPELTLQEQRILKLKRMTTCLQDGDLHSLQQLGTSIQSFHKHSSLKRSKTFDHSNPSLDNPDLRLSLSIRNFDKDKSLKRSQTLDKSSPVLESLRHSLSIQHFDTSSLKHVLPVDKSSPMHIISLTRSFSCYTNYSDEPPDEEAGEEAVVVAMQAKIDEFTSKENDGGLTKTEEFTEITCDNRIEETKTAEEAAELETCAANSNQLEVVKTLSGEENCETLCNEKLAENSESLKRLDDVEERSDSGTKQDTDDSVSDISKAICDNVSLTDNLTTECTATELEGKSVHESSSTFYDDETISDGNAEKCFPSDLVKPITNSDKVDVEEFVNISVNIREEKCSGLENDHAASAVGSDVSKDDTKTCMKNAKLEVERRLVIN